MGTGVGTETDADDIGTQEPARFSHSCDADEYTPSWPSPTTATLHTRTIISGPLV